MTSASSPGEDEGAIQPKNPVAPGARTGGLVADCQNDPWSIRLLAAQRQLYSEAKQWRRLRAWSATAMAIIGVGVTLLWPTMLTTVGVVGAVLAVAQWLASIIERRRIKAAATIQEQFDTSVYGLDWNPVLGARPDGEDVIAADSRFKGDRAKLAGWYNVPADAPHQLGVLLSQRSNLRWDSELRRAYANTVVGGLILLAIVILVVGLAKDLTLRALGLSLLPSVGALLVGAETVCSHYHHCAAQSELKRTVESTWEKARADARKVRLQDLRAVQDGIYHLRASAPPVPDVFYWKRRDRFERETQLAVEQMWREIKASLPTSTLGDGYPP